MTSAYEIFEKGGYVNSDGVIYGYKDGLEEKVYDLLNDFKKIDSLDKKTQTKFIVSSKEDVLGELIESNAGLAVGGAAWGDEGKGKTVDALARDGRVRAIFKWNSGANAGHTISVGGEDFICHIIPSSILVDDVINYIGPEVTADPVSLLDKEISKVAEKVPDYKDRLFVDNFHITTPYHRLMDILGNLRSLKEDSDVKDVINQNVSTMQGISPSHSSMVTKKSPRLNDLYNDKDNLKNILKDDMKQYYSMLWSRRLSEAKLFEACDYLNELMPGRVPDHVIEFLKKGMRKKRFGMAPDFDTNKQFNAKINHLVRLYQERVVENDAFPEMKDVNYELDQCLKNGMKILTEATQSSPLRNANASHYRSTTSANTSLPGVMACSDMNTQVYRNANLNVLKYPGSSRVGKGANVSGLISQTFFSDNNIDSLETLEGICNNFEEIDAMYWDSIQENGIFKPQVYTDEDGTKYSINVAYAITMAKKFQECGATSKKPRVLSASIDCPLLYGVMRQQGPLLSMSAVDRGDDCTHTGLTVAYVYCHPEGIPTFSHGKWYGNMDVIRPGDPMPYEEVLKHCQPIQLKIPGWKGNSIAKREFQPGEELHEGMNTLFGLTNDFCMPDYKGQTIFSFGNGKAPANMGYIRKVEPKSAIADTNMNQIM